MTPCRLLVVGASGSGTTTLGRAVADAWAVPHADLDDYFWRPTDPAYVEQRPVQERLDLMEQVFLPRRTWVLSGSPVSWGAEVVARCQAVVFLTLAPEERLRRLRVREQRRGEGVDEAFLAWAAAYDDPAATVRSRARHEAWLAGLSRPVVRLDSAGDVSSLVEQVVAHPVV